jgi:hypothetical protein
MDIFLRVWAVLLFLAGAPFFLSLAAMFGTLTFLEPPNNPQDAVPKFLLTYIAFGMAGLLTAAGGVLWGVAKMAYPLKEQQKVSGRRLQSTESPSP